MWIMYKDSRSFASTTPYCKIKILHLRDTLRSQSDNVPHGRFLFCHSHIRYCGYSNLELSANDSFGGFLLASLFPMPTHGFAKLLVRHQLSLKTVYNTDTHVRRVTNEWKWRSIRKIAFCYCLVRSNPFESMTSDILTCFFLFFMLSS